MIKEGDKLVCVNNGEVDRKYNGKGYNTYIIALTIGKIYEVYKTLNTGEGADGMVWVLDDNGKYTGFVTKRFILLAEYREQQINSILND